MHTHTYTFLRNLLSFLDYLVVEFYLLIHVCFEFVQSTYILMYLSICEYPMLRHRQYAQYVHILGEATAEQSQTGGTNKFKEN